MRGPKSPIIVNIKKSYILKITKISKSFKAAHSMVIRATIILLISIGLSITDISKRTNTTRNTVKKWAKRYNEFGIIHLIKFRNYYFLQFMFSKNSFFIVL